MEPLTRRRFVGTATLAGATWLTPISQMLARAAEAKPARHATAQSVIILWMQGGPSQLETFDPHPGTTIAGGSKAIATTLKGVQLGDGFGRLAEQMEHISLVRSVVSKEGDHERGTTTIKSGYRPDPTIVYPSIGAIAAHELSAAGCDIPRHVSILSSQWPARGGFLGDQFDAFRTDDPAGAVPDTQSFLTPERDSVRLKHLDVLEASFAKGRSRRVEATLHKETLADARKMMTFEQLKAFDVSKEPLAVRKLYGDTPFGRGCLAARRLTEVGVRCVEVNLTGWDTHINNHAFTASQMEILDPAFAALIQDLHTRKLLDKTIVLCAGEFGRTPRMNPTGGRDHWPSGFSVALAGGGIRGGQIIGETDPEGKAEPKDPVEVGDLHATILKSLGIDFEKVSQTPIGRTFKFAEGEPIEKLLVGR